VKRCKGSPDGGEEACIFDACAMHARYQPAGRLQRKFEMGQPPQLSGAYQRHALAGIALPIVGAFGLCAAVAVTIARTKSWHGYSAAVATPAEDASPLLLTE